VLFDAPQVAACIGRCKPCVEACPAVDASTISGRFFGGNAVAAALLQNAARIELSYAVLLLQVRPSIRLDHDYAEPWLVLVQKALQHQLHLLEWMQIVANLAIDLYQGEVEVREA
jgi:ferredoxin